LKRREKEMQCEAEETAATIEADADDPDDNRPFLAYKEPLQSDAGALLFAHWSMLSIG
jgi:hypothetical protein